MTERWHHLETWCHSLATFTGLHPLNGGVTKTVVALIVTATVTWDGAAFSHCGVVFTPDSWSQELTQSGPFYSQFYLSPLFNSFQLCLAHSYCNGLHSDRSMCSLFCCQGFRWMEGAVGSTGGEVKEGWVVTLPCDSCRSLGFFIVPLLLLQGFSSGNQLMFS